MIVVSYCISAETSATFGIHSRPNLIFVFLFFFREVLRSLNMQKTVLLCLIVCASSLAAPAPQMTDAQLEQTLADRNTMQRHLKCATGEGPCDPVGRRLRTLAPLVLRGACPQCSVQETRQIRRTLAHIQRNYPWEWAKIVRQYG